ncbi:hypothetical protein LEN26_017037 [Aphanomyces euteiches]|nr:hypothetical protein LEN26_017037 [Aphanomyces euteiches]KAH9114260.1 hypothetical protein AeMF1_011632 [Aphanomyces euteiches]KAH9181011.1 hypothetical protein AeNC1_017012 [Aphanomyces euteiches]KAH9185832.1 hypothetical protein AeNC1_012189 [Aphanomyces euteiches]
MVESLVWLISSAGWHWVGAAMDTACSMETVVSGAEVPHKGVHVAVRICALLLAPMADAVPSGVRLVAAVVGDALPSVAMRVAFVKARKDRIDTLVENALLGH